MEAVEGTSGAAYPDSGGRPVQWELTGRSLQTRPSTVTGPGKLPMHEFEQASWLPKSICIRTGIIKHNPEIKELMPGTMKHGSEIACSHQGQNMSPNGLN